ALWVAESGRGQSWNVGQPVVLCGVSSAWPLASCSNHAGMPAGECSGQSTIALVMPSTSNVLPQNGPCPKPLYDQWWLCDWNSPRTGLPASLSSNAKPSTLTSASG